MSVVDIQDAPARYVGADAVAEFLDMSVKWTMNQTRRAQDPLPHRKFGRYVRFLLPEVQEWAARQTRGKPGVRPTP